MIGLTDNLDWLDALVAEANPAPWTLQEFVDHIDIRSPQYGITLEVPGLTEEDWTNARLAALSPTLAQHAAAMARALRVVAWPFDSTMTALEVAEQAREALAAFDAMLTEARR